MVIAIAYYRKLRRSFPNEAKNFMLSVFDLRNRLSLISVTVSLMLMSGCMREESIGPDVVARVRDRMLTTNEVNAWEASLQQSNVPRNARQKFVEQWVEEELLFQAALDNDLDEDPWVKQRIDELTRSVIISRYLTLESNKLPQPSPRTVRDYFEQRRQEFVWAHLNLVVEYWRSDDKTGMDKLRAKLLRGHTNDYWYGKAESLDNGRISLDGQGSADPTVWNTISKLEEAQVSPVLKIDKDYWIFKLKEKHKPNEPKEIDSVRDEIVARLIEEGRRQHHEKLIRSIVEKYRHNGWLDWTNTTTTVSVIEKTADDGGDQSE